MRNSAIPFLFLVLVLFGAGCGGKKEPIQLDFYCSETFLTVMSEEASLFESVYGIRLRLRPIFLVLDERPVAEQAASTETAESDPEPKRRALSSWRGRPSEHRLPKSGETKMNQEVSDLVLAIAENKRSGDLFLTDSERQLELLKSGTTASFEYSFALLSLELLTERGNPHGIKSVAELLKSGLKLGIANPAHDGMGEAAFRLAERYSRSLTGNQGEERIIVFERHDKLLAGLQEKKVDAVLVWKSLGIQAKSFADPVTLPDNEKTTLQMPLISLSTATNQLYGKRFADFLISPKGREILKLNGFEPTPL